MYESVGIKKNPYSNTWPIMKSFRNKKSSNGREGARKEERVREQTCLTNVQAMPNIWYLTWVCAHFACGGAQHSTHQKKRHNKAHNNILNVCKHTYYILSVIYRKQLTTITRLLQFFRFIIFFSFFLFSYLTLLRLLVAVFWRTHTHTHTKQPNK